MMTLMRAALLAGCTFWNEMKQQEDAVVTRRSNMYGDKYVDEMINEGLRVDDNQQKPAACLNNMTE